MSFCRLVIFLFFTFNLIFARRSTYIKTKYGQLEGFIIDLDDRSKADIFLNIPYAKPPVGELRFERPQPQIPWKGTRKAKNFGPGCVPHVLGAVKIEDVSEDCLTLNIFRPRYKRTRPLTGYPVLVWVHGGGFGIGSAQLYGYQKISDNFVAQDLIVVTVQYRLGHLGYLSTGDSSMPGNYGLWDLAQAFKFIHENIADFGGNPNKITAWGLSAGGAAVSVLTLSPYSRDYIANSIEMSGAALAGWAGSDAVVGTTKDFARQLNCLDQDLKKVKECLKDKSVKELLDAAEKIGKANFGINMLKYHPRIDGEFFPKNYVESIKESEPKPSMIGFTNNESAYFTLLCLAMPLNELCIPQNLWSTYSEQNLTNFIRGTVAPASKFGSKSSQVQQKLIDFYINREKPESADCKFYLERYTQVFTDTSFIIPGIWTAQQKMLANWTTFMYLNEHYNPKAFSDEFPAKGAVHASEYTYLLGLMVLGDYKLDDADKIVLKMLKTAIGNFVKTGNPSIENLPWPSLTPENPLTFMNIKKDSEVKEGLMEDRLNFWNDLAENYDYDIIRDVFKPPRNDSQENETREIVLGSSSARNSSFGMTFVIGIFVFWHIFKKFY